MSQNNEKANVQLKVKGTLNYFPLSNSETAESTSSGIFTYDPTHILYMLVIISSDGYV